MIRFVSLFILTSCFFTPSLAHACHGTTLSESIWMLFSKPFFILTFFILFGFLLAFRLVRKKYSSAVRLQKILKIATIVAILPLLFYVISFTYIALYAKC